MLKDIEYSDVYSSFFQENKKEFVDFLYIGAGRTGSSWISQVLREHPQIFIPKVKDIQFFDYQFDKGMEWYKSFFSGRRDERMAGELSHDYFMVPGCAERIHRELPGVKLIVCLRDPIERALSRYVYALAHEIKPSVGMDEFLLQPRILAEGMYGRNLQPFFRYFGRDRILVLFYDDLVSDSAAFVRALYAFLGVDPDFIPPSLQKPVLAALKARSPLLGRMAALAAKRLRQAGMASIVGRVKHHPLWNRIMYQQPTAKPVVSERLREVLRNAYADDQVLLRGLLGRDLPWQSAHETHARTSAP